MKETTRTFPGEFDNIKITLYKIRITPASTGTCIEANTLPNQLLKWDKLETRRVSTHRVLLER